MIRLVHLSDIHITAAKLEWTPADWFNKRYAAWFNFRWLGRRHRFRHADTVLTCLMEELRQRRPDRIIFSGDATALGFESELRRATEFLDVDGGVPGLAVPGNHDYCTVAAASSGLFERYFAPWQKGERIDQHTYPFAQQAGGFWLVGVNSCTGNRWAWDAAGSVGPDQLDRLARLLDRLSPEPRILVTHYPVGLANGRRERKTHGLRDLDALVKVAAEGGVCLWLHGHRHHTYQLVDTDLAPFPVICSGSATQTGCWSYGEYVIDQQRLSGLQRVYDLQAACFRDGPRFELNLGAARLPKSVEIPK
jgi:3',5'-cyclic AMP phosphodiesterase CpdA